MSSMLWALAAAVASALPITAEQALEAARAFYASEPARHEICPQSSEREIVVCDVGNPEQYRVPSDTDRGVVKGQGLRAPDLEPNYGGVPVGRGCFLPPCPRPMPIMIDLGAIPEAPPGSDADRIGRGESPEP